MCVHRHIYSETSSVFLCITMKSLAATVLPVILNFLCTGSWNPHIDSCFQPPSYWQSESPTFLPYSSRWWNHARISGPSWLKRAASPPRTSGWAGSSAHHCAQPQGAPSPPRAELLQRDLKAQVGTEAKSGLEIGLFAV